MFQMGGWNHQLEEFVATKTGGVFFCQDEVAEGDRREDVLQCRALGERALRPDGPGDSTQGGPPTIVINGVITFIPPINTATV